MITSDLDAVTSRPPLNARTATSSELDRASPRRFMISRRGTLAVSANVAELTGWSVACFTICFDQLSSWGGSLERAWIAPLSVLSILGSLVAIATIWSLRRIPRRLQVAIVAAAATALFLHEFLAVIGAPSYGTDEIAFDQYAAQLLFFHGLDPYLYSMAPSFQLFHVPDIYHTYTIAGKVVNSLSYPAGSFLAYLPALVVGLRDQAAVVSDSACWLGAAVLIWLVLPRSLKWLSVVLMLAGPYVGFSAGGVSDMLFLPFLVAALWRWDRYGDSTERSVARWIGPITMGIACTIKQTPWFILLLIVAGIAIEASQRGQSWIKVAGRYVGIVAGIFFVVNLPFIVMGARAWLHDIIATLTNPTVPGGQGLIGLTIFSHMGGKLILYTMAGVLGFLLMGGLTLGWYSIFKRALPILVEIGFVFPTRTFSSYLVVALPAALVAAVTVAPSEFRGFRWVRRATCAVGGLLGASVLLALVSKPDITLKLLDETSTGEIQTINYLTLQVANNGPSKITPHYAVTSGGHQTSFWNVVSGPTALPPHSTRRVQLEAPNFQSMPSMDGGFIVDAYTASPAQMATSSTVRPASEDTWLVPADINRPVRIGQKLQFEVQVTDQFGNPIRRAGIPIELSQIVYSEYGVAPGEAVINNSYEGETPVGAVTNKNGIAHFVVVGAQPQPDPVFFQAWIDDNGQPPHSYSNMVTVQFR
jgi:uncharacterized membrane protein